MIGEFKNIKKLFETKKARQEMLGEQLSSELDSLDIAKDEIESSSMARSVIQQVAEMTQKKLEYRISTLVSTALSAVFEDPYAFEVEFVQKRNKTECNLWFVKGGHRVKPIDASGGGPLDIASFALRAAFWSLRKTRPVLLLDEPFKFVSPDLQSKCSEMLKMISEKLGFQIIMNSHQPEIIDSVDKVFDVRLIRGVSQVTEVEKTKTKKSPA